MPPRLHLMTQREGIGFVANSPDKQQRRETAMQRRHLRRKLADSSVQIVTVTGVGYKLVA